MNKEFLEDYHQKEIIDFNNYLKIKEGTKRNSNSSLNIEYPSKSRFPKILEPITVTHAQRSNIFGIIPFYGSVIIPIAPVQKEQFKMVTGLDPNYIEEIVDFSKKNGKIFFELSTPAQYFEKLDYLAPIFHELKPPEIYHILDPKISNNKEFQKYQVEFSTLSNFGYYEFIRFLGRSYAITGQNLTDGAAIEIFNIDMKAYSFAKISGYNELTDLILDIMMSGDYPRVHDLLEILHRFLLLPNMDSFAHPHNYSKFFLSYLQSSIPKNESKNFEPISPLPFEVGRFLLRKLAVWSDDFDACKSIIDYYGQTDLHRLMVDLNKGIQENNLQLMLTTKDELDIVLDDMWEDSEKIRRRKNVAEVGLPISLAVLGELASGFNGLGMLASLGYSVLDKILSAKRSAISEEIGKINQKSHLIGIHDFKTKYSEKLRGLEKSR